MLCKLFPFLNAQLKRESACYFFSNGVLNTKNVGKILIECFRPKRPPGLDLDQACRHANSLASLLNASVEDNFRSDIAAGVYRVLVGIRELSYRTHGPDDDLF